jgi:hypothetical protein
MTYLSAPILTIITYTVTSMKETFFECIKGISNVLRPAVVVPICRIKKMPILTVNSPLIIAPRTDFRSIKNLHVVLR